MKTCDHSLLCSFLIVWKFDIIYVVLVDISAAGRVSDLESEG